MTVTIIGLGLIGCSIALDLKDNGFASKIIGVDKLTENATDALSLNIVDEIMPLLAAVEISDLIILAIPVDAIVQILPIILDEVKNETVITDVGSTKHVIFASIKNHKNKKHFVGSHPMSGTEYSGPKAAVRNLFKDKVAIICNKDESHTWAVNRIEKMYKALQSRVLYFNAKDHDEHVGYVSHLSHVISYALANAVLEKEKSTKTIFDLAAGGFASTARLAKSPDSMWVPIFLQNKDNVLPILDVYIDKLLEFKTHLTNKDSMKLSSFIKDANKIQKVLDKKSADSNTKAF